MPALQTNELRRLATLAPASESDLNTGSDTPLMDYSCEICVNRKVKCDKATPMCARCSKSKLECFYRVRTSRRSKSGLLSGVIDIPAKDTTPRTSIPVNERSRPALSQAGKLITSRGRSRYIDNNHWHSLEDELGSPSCVEADDAVTSNDMPDPLTDALMNTRGNLLTFHPSH